MNDDTHEVPHGPVGLQALSRGLERPMLLLSFVWFLVIVTELVNGISPFLLGLGTVLWALFVLYLGLRFAIASDRLIYLKKNWLFIGHPDAGQRSAIIYSIVVSCITGTVCKLTTLLRMQPKGGVLDKLVCDSAVHFV